MTELDFSPSVSWYKLNVGQYGFYRVNYPAADWANLAGLLASNPQVPFIITMCLRPQYLS